MKIKKPLQFAEVIDKQSDERRTEEAKKAEDIERDSKELN